MTRRVSSTTAMRTSSLFAALVLAASAAPAARAADLPPFPVTHQHFNFFEGVIFDSAQANGPGGDAVYRNPPSPICSSTGTAGADVDIDCEGTAPHNETTIAVNPLDPQNLIGSANDYQLFLTPGGQINETAYSRSHVSFDGGLSWTTYPIDYHGYASTGDPAVAFDADGTAYLATLGFVWSQGSRGVTNPDILVAHSTDGGRNWSAPSRVASGTGSVGVGVFNDKEFLAAWGSGNAIVTWTVFQLGIRGSYIRSAIFASVTHDGGNTWSPGAEISGAAPFCIGAQGGTTCDQSQGSTPVVAADGSIYVAFENTADPVTGRDQYLVVQVDPATGTRLAGPFRVADVFDGFTDYPINVDGRQTYQDSQFRTWSVGNIAADPTNARHLAVIWSDMRNSTLPAPSDPYTAKTNSDVVASQSFDRGATWSAPVAIRAARDQFMPWGVYDATGRLRIGYFDRSYDSANHRYGYTVATETSRGSLAFAFAQATDALSDPTRGDRWFSGRTPNPSFPNPTTFLGDYSGIAAAPAGVSALWTDMRLPVCFTVRCGTGEDAFFGVVR